MLLTYIDETIIKKKEHYLVGLVVESDQVGPLEAALEKVVAGAFPDVSLGAELHGHPLLQGKDDWEPLHAQVDRRAAIYLAALRVIATHADRFYVRGVQVERFREKYTATYEPHLAAMSFLFELVDEYAARRGETYLSIADECSHQARVRSDLRGYRTHGTWGYKGRKITNAVDTIHFGPSDASRLLQAVDLVAYVWQRKRRHQERRADAQKLTDSLWDAIAPIYADEPRALWHP